MSRKSWYMAGVWAAVPMFLAGLSLLDGDRLAQSGVAVIYALAVFGLTRAANKAA